MNTQTKSNLIASIILALAPFGLFGFAMPAGELIAGVAITAALAGLAVMDLKQGGFKAFKRSTHPRF